MARTLKLREAKNFVISGGQRRLTLSSASPVIVLVRWNQSGKVHEASRLAGVRCLILIILMTGCMTGTILAVPDIFGISVKIAETKR